MSQLCSRSFICFVFSQYKFESRTPTVTYESAPFSQPRGNPGNPAREFRESREFMFLSNRNHGGNQGIQHFEGIQGIQPKNCLEG